MSGDVDLDGLFQEARAYLRSKAAAEAAEKKSVRRLKASEGDPPPVPLELFTNPDNWIVGRGVALIHAETQTLLGNFTELTHKTVAGARRLVRTEELLVVDAVEQVSGDWWIKREEAPEPPQAWHEKHDTIIHVSLPRLGVHCPLCEVTVHLSYGSMARVELAADTLFAQMTGEAHLLTLPAGTNIISEMSQDSKVALRQEIQSCHNA